MKENRKWYWKNGVAVTTTKKTKINGTGLRSGGQQQEYILNKSKAWRAL